MNERGDQTPPVDFKIEEQPNATKLETQVKKENIREGGKEIEVFKVTDTQIDLNSGKISNECSRFFEDEAQTKKLRENRTRCQYGSDGRLSRYEKESVDGQGKEEWAHKVDVSYPEKNAVRQRGQNEKEGKAWQTTTIEKEGVIKCTNEDTEGPNKGRITEVEYSYPKETSIKSPDGRVYEGRIVVERHEVIEPGLIQHDKGAVTIKTRVHNEAGDCIAYWREKPKEKK
jgi:hypothetical protein